MFDMSPGRRLWVERPVRGFAVDQPARPLWVLTGAGSAGGLCTCRTWLSITVETRASILHADHSVCSMSPTHKTIPLFFFFFEGDYFLGLVLTCKAFWKLLEKSVNKCIGPE